MPNTRDFKSLGVIASSATPITDRQGNRVQGTAYRNTDVTLENQQEGLVYDSVAVSENMNQKLFNQSSFTDVIDSRGILGWSDDIDYVAPAIVSASNGKLYIARDASGNGTPIAQPIDPASTTFDVSTWWVEFESAAPLREELADETAGDEGSRLVGYNKSNINGGIDEGATVKDSLDELYKNTPELKMDFFAYGYVDQEVNNAAETIFLRLENTFNINLQNNIVPFLDVRGTGMSGCRVFFINPISLPYSIHISPSNRASNSRGHRGYYYSFGELSTTYFDMYMQARDTNGVWNSLKNDIYNTFSFYIYKLRGN